MSAPRAASDNADTRAAAQRTSRGRAGPRGAASSVTTATKNTGAVSGNISPDAPLLLDTHVWVWLLSGETTHMHKSLPARIERIAENGNCFVSDISAWEVATKSARQVLSLSMEPSAWLDAAAQAPGIQHVHVSRDVLIASARLPQQLPDFVDRVLVATALRFGLTVVTADAALLSFASTWPLFRALDARP